MSIRFEMKERKDTIDLKGWAWATLLKKTLKLNKPAILGFNLMARTDFSQKSDIQHLK
jgi:hypothetical protein